MRDIRMKGPNPCVGLYYSSGQGFTAYYLRERNGAPDLSCDFFSNELDWRIERGQVWQMEQNESENQGHTKLCLASLFLKAYFSSRGYKKKTCLIHFLVY